MKLKLKIFMKTEKTKSEDKIFTKRKNYLTLVNIEKNPDIMIRQLT